jgi:spore coat protein CotF
MTVLKQSELNWIREVVTGHQTSASKLAAYAEQVQDPQLKQMFSKSAGEAKQSAQKLIGMIN